MTPRAWEDFASFLETGANVQHRGDCERGDVLAPAEVADLFNELQAKFASGDRAALWAGIRSAAQYNVPMPYWLADALLAVDKALHDTAQSAHTLLGLDGPLPVGKKGKKHDLATRVKLRQQRALWLEVTRLRADARAAGRHLPDTAAITTALKRLGVHMSYSKARAMLLAQDELQRAYSRRYLRVQVNIL